MKKEVGSIFPINSESINLAESGKAEFAGNRIFYSLCREALYDIALSHNDSNKIVLIPAYTCQTVITPFKEAGWTCELYSINKNLRIDIQNLIATSARHQPTLIVVHPFFGMDLNTEEVLALKELNAQGIKIVLDLTQCIFSTSSYPFVSYTVGSYRKWFPIPDGAFLECNSNERTILQPEEENPEFSERELAAMYLRNQYFGNGEQLTKDISIRLSKAADHIAETNITPHKMSHIAYNIFIKEDSETNQHRRFENYSFLFKNVRESMMVEKVCKNLQELTTAPLYFTIFVQDRPALQRLLAQDAIYAPVIWPVEDDAVLINEDVKYIYDHILAIPCDQRYDENDMQRAVDIINKY